MRNPVSRRQSYARGPQDSTPSLPPVSEFLPPTLLTYCTAITTTTYLLQLTQGTLGPLGPL